MVCVCECERDVCGPSGRAHTFYVRTRLRYIWFNVCLCMFSWRCAHWMGWADSIEVFMHTQLAKYGLDRYLVSIVKHSITRCMFNSSCFFFNEEKVIFFRSETKNPLLVFKLSSASDDSLLCIAFLIFWPILEECTV